MITKFLIIKPDKKQFDITEAISSVTWEGDYQQSARRLSFSLVGSTMDSSIPIVDIPLGTVVVFYVDNKELFRGMVFTRNLEGINFNYTVYDDGVRLIKIRGYYNFKDKNVVDICNQLCVDYNIPKGTFPSTNKKITKVFIGNTLYDIIMYCYTEVSKITGIKYMCVFREGKISVIEKGKEVLKISFEEGNNIISNNFSESIENIVNKIVVVDNNGVKKAHYFKQDQIDLYGLFQEVLLYSDGIDMKTEAESKYKDIEQRASLNGYGNVSCVTGYGITVKDTKTKMVGLFQIDSDRHTWESGDYKIELNLNFKNIMDEVEAGQLEQTVTNVDTYTNNYTGNIIGTIPNYTPSYDTDVSEMSRVISITTNLVTYAKSKLGKPYVWGATGPNSFDCSGFTQWCYRQVGITIPRTSSQQANFGTTITWGKFQTGDLLFFATGSTSAVSHVGLYIGGGRMIHASNPKTDVKYDDIMTSTYYQRTFVRAKRVI